MNRCNIVRSLTFTFKPGILNTNISLSEAVLCTYNFPAWQMHYSQPSHCRSNIFHLITKNTLTTEPHHQNHYTTIHLQYSIFAPLLLPHTLTFCFLLLTSLLCPDLMTSSPWHWSNDPTPSYFVLFLRLTLSSSRAFCRAASFLARFWASFFSFSSSL